MLCGTCNTKVIEEGKKGYTSAASCSKCTNRFHAACLGRDDNKLLRTNALKFVCPSCRIKMRTLKTDSSPIRDHKDSKEHELKSSPDFLSAAKSLSAMQVPEQVLISFTSAMQQLKEVFVSMKNEMCSLTKSLSSTSNDIDQFRNDLSEMKFKLRELECYKDEVHCLRAEVAELRLELSNKEQRGLLKDVEITGLTEVKGENLQQLVSVLSTKLGVECDQFDIDDVRRVGMHGGGAGGLERPRPVIITFTRRAPRDAMLRAARVRRGLTTTDMEVPGNSRRVYVNEHLTKTNRVLFSKSRSIGAKLNFRFIWTSNGSILMRRSETSSILRVTSEAVLEKLQKKVEGRQPSPPPTEHENCP